MDVGAVADVLEDMPARRERRLADPVGALGAHLGVALGMTVLDALDHVVAADAGIGARAFRDDGAGVVRTAGAEIGRALGDIARIGEHLLRTAKRRDATGELLVVPPGDEALADGDADGVGVERPFRREQPLPALVLLADHRRLVGGAVEDLLDLRLDQPALLLDHDDGLEAGGELADDVRLQRPGAGNLQQAQSKVGRPRLVDAEIVQRLKHVVVALAGGDDADARLAPAGEHQAVRRVGAQERQNRRYLEFVETLFLGERIIVGPDVETARRHAETAGDHGRHTVERAVDRGGRFDIVLDAFQPDPGAGVARHGIAEEAVVEDLLHAGRIEDRDHRIDEGELGLVRRGRGFAGVVVAHQRQHAAPRRGAGKVGVAQRVAGAVDARPLAVPEAEYAVETAVAAQFGLLRPPQRGRRKVFVDTRIEDDARRLQHIGGAPQLLVEAAQRRAAIAGDVARGIDALSAVARPLHQQQANHRLGAADQNRSAWRGRICHQG